MIEILAYILIFANLLNLIHLGLFVVGANVYDIKEFKRKKDARSQTQVVSKAKPQPLVSVIISALNEQLSIRRTLDSIRRSTYQNIEVIVVNDGSKDNTAEIVRNYAATQKDTVTTSRIVRARRSGRA